MEKILQNLIEKSPELLNFFAGYFPEAEFTGATDKDVVENYILTNNIETVKQTQQQLQALENDPEVLKIIAREVNKHFETSEKIWKWVEMIKEVYAKKVDKL